MIIHRIDIKTGIVNGLIYGSSREGGIVRISRKIQRTGCAGPGKLGTVIIGGKCNVGCSAVADGFAQQRICQNWKRLDKNFIGCRHTVAGIFMWGDIIVNGIKERPGINQRLINGSSRYC